jgi:tRNA(fMet)-specific endonuclease VapC
MVFIDTCILIDISKKRIQMNDKQNYCLNSVVEMEFLVGAFNKKELNLLNQQLNGFNLVHLDQDIFALAVQLINHYALSHRMTIYDAIIAATCMVYDLPLWTHNKKDFQFLNLVLV